MSKINVHPRKYLPVVALILAACLALAGSAPALASDPTCSDVLDIATHGQHVVGDYVTGIGHAALGWPPTGQMRDAAGQVGDAIGGEGAALPGGPGPGFHFPNGFAPGASFCNSQSQSPGFHVP